MTDPSFKPALRRLLRARRAAWVSALDAASLDVATNDIADHVTAAFADAQVVAGYISNSQEVDPLPALARAAAEGRSTALPRVVDRAAPLTFHLWSPGDDLTEGPWGLRQPRADAPPAAPDLILAPLLGFDRRLNRLGQGAGFYDRAFTALPRARRVGLAWSVQMVESLPIDPWDIPLHALATETEWITP